MTELIPRGDKAINERYRPMRFSEVIGLQSNKDALTKWIERGKKRSRALLFFGAPGSGKTTLARVLAMALNCEKGDSSEPCLECPSCKAAMADKAMHISEYNMSALTRKDDAEEIVLSMSNSCFTGRNKVYILDEVQGVSAAAQNLMLKALENPTQDTYIILCTTDPQKLLKPLRSRCEQYEFRNPTQEDIKVLLSTVVKQEMPEMTVDQRKEILKACEGLSYREILMKLEKYIKGGGTGNITDAFEADYFGFAKFIMSGDFLTAVDYIDKNKEHFDIEAARRVTRTFMSNQIIYSTRENKIEFAKRCSVAFSFLDKGFYTDPNPLPSFKNDLFLACMTLLGKL